MRSFDLTCSVMLLAVTGAAQRTWVVDPNGGGNFTDVTTAIATATAGDTLLIRGGAWGNVTVDKALSLVGDVPTPHFIRLTTAAPGASAVVQLNADTLVVGGPAVSLENVTGYTATSNAAVVSMRNCRFGTFADGPGLTVTAGDVTLNACTLMGTGSLSLPQGIGSCFVTAAQPALRVTGGDVTIANSSLRGASSANAVILCTFYPTTGYPSAAAEILGGAVAVTQSTLIGGVGGTGIRTAAVVGPISADASAVFDPPAAAAAIRLPATDGAGSRPGIAITCAAQGPPGTVGFLAASIGLRAPTPTPLGPAWVDLAGYVIVRWGVLDNTGRLAATIAVPATAPRGLPLTLQSAVVADGVVLSTGVPAVVHVL